MKKLKSKNVVQILDFIVTPNYYYIAQELCNSKTLKNYIENFPNNIVPEKNAK